MRVQGRDYWPRELGEAYLDASVGVWLATRRSEEENKLKFQFSIFFNKNIVSISFFVLYWKEREVGKKAN